MIITNIINYVLLPGSASYSEMFFFLVSELQAIAEFGIIIQIGF